MSSNLVSIEPSAKLQTAVALMRSKTIRRLVVLQSNELKGIVCHRDLSKAAERIGTVKQANTIQEIMSSPVVTISQDDPIEKAAQLMTKYHIGALVVTRQKTPIGIITESDIFRAFTFLLSGSSNSIRITFDTTNKEDILKYLVTSTEKFKIQLKSYLSFLDKDRSLAVVIIQGSNLDKFIDELWDSGRPVVNLVRF